MSKRYTILTTLFCVCLVASNLFETKIFMAGSLILTGGLTIFPISYILNDCITELYGYKHARFVIWNAMILNIFVVAMAQLVRILPSAEFSDAQQHFDYIFKADLRITIASMAAFLCGSLLNSKVMSTMKSRQGDKGFSVRAIVSSLVGESADSIIFFPIAFWHVGFKNMLIMMAIQIVLKTLYEIIVLPVTISVINYMKRHSGDSDTHPMQ